MNKLLCVIPCIVAYSFVCASEGERKLPPLPSPRPSTQQGSPRSSDSLSVRPRMPSNPIARVKKQSTETQSFINEENANDFMTRKRRSESFDTK